MEGTSSDKSGAGELTTVPKYKNMEKVKQYVKETKCAKIKTLPDKYGNEITIITAIEYGAGKWNPVMQQCIFRSMMYFNGIYYGGIPKFFNHDEAFDRNAIVIDSMKRIFEEGNTVKVILQNKANGENASFFVAGDKFYFCQKNGIVTADSKEELEQMETHFTHAVEVGILFFEYFEQLSDEMQSELMEFLKKHRVFCEKINPRKHQHPASKTSDVPHLEVFAITTIGPGGTELHPREVADICSHFGASSVGNYDCETLPEPFIELRSFKYLQQIVETIYNDSAFSEGAVMVITDHDGNIIGRLKAKNKLYCMLRRLRGDIVLGKPSSCIDEIVARFGEVTDEFYNVLVNVYLLAKEYDDVNKKFADIRTRAEAVPVKSRGELALLLKECHIGTCTLIVYGNAITGSGKSYFAEILRMTLECPGISKDLLEQSGFKGKRLHKEFEKRLERAVKTEDYVVLDRSYPGNALGGLNKLITNLKKATGKEIKIVSFQVPDYCPNLLVTAMYNVMTRVEHPIMPTDTEEKKMHWLKIFIAFLKMYSSIDYSEIYARTIGETTVIPYIPVNTTEVITEEFKILKSSIDGLLSKSKKPDFSPPKGAEIGEYHQIMMLVTQLYEMLNTRLAGKIYNEIDMSKIREEITAAKTTEAVPKWTGYSVCEKGLLIEAIGCLEMELAESLVNKVIATEEFHMTAHVNFDGKNSRAVKQFMKEFPESCVCTLGNIIYVPSEKNGIMCITVQVNTDVTSITRNLHITVWCGTETQPVESNYIIEQLLQIESSLYTEKIDKTVEMAGWGPEGGSGIAIISDELYGKELEMKKHNY